MMENKITAEGAFLSCGRKDVLFNTETDTEVLFEFLKNYNCKNLETLNGMWSFAFYDEKNHHLTLSRDLLGERHLFYLVEDNKLYFCSEVKPLLYVSDKIKEFDEKNIIESWKYNSCGPRNTLIKNIYRLEPGTNLEISKSRIKKKQNIKLNIDPWLKFFKKNPGNNEIFDKFDEMIHEEVKLRIPTDVPFYCTLSGGIDSSIITYITKTIEPNFTKSFFIISGPKETKKYKGYSELNLSNIVAKKFDIEHKIIKLNSKKFNVDNFKKISKNSFEGCIDPIQINFRALSYYLKKKGIKVILMSEGPDEFLSGYTTDIEAAKVDKIYSNLKKSHKKFNYSKFKERVKRLNLKRLKDFDISYSPFRSRVVHDITPEVFLKKIFKKYKNKKFNSYDYLAKKYKKFKKRINYPQIRALNYANKTIPDMINLRKDKSMMANSVEPRFPFLAKNIVEFLIAMPNKFRFKGQYKHGKYFLRKYCEKKISKIVSNYPKRGMGDYVWNADKNIFNILNIEKKVKNSKLFKKPLFKKDAIKEILDKNTHKANLWSAYVLSETYKELLRINRTKKSLF